jgi:predicted nucleotidyltransferase
MFIITFVTKMITIFKQGYEKILKNFYENKFLKFHLRELSRLTKLHEPSVSKFLNDLEKIQILKSEKDGNLKKYSITKNKKTYLIFQKFDIDNLEKLPKLRQNAINIFLKTLKEKPIFVILFGSTSKGNYKASSDIDLLLITNNKIETNNAEKEVQALTGLNISSFQINYFNFIQELKLKEDKVIQSALNSGYPIYNHLTFYEVFFNERI